LVKVIVNVKMEGLGFVEQEMIVVFGIVSFSKGSKDQLHNQVDNVTKTPNVMIR